jgi:hypothetical protein
MVLLSDCVSGHALVAKMESMWDLSTAHRLAAQMVLLSDCVSGHALVAEMGSMWDR